MKEWERLLYTDMAYQEDLLLEKKAGVQHCL